MDSVKTMRIFQAIVQNGSLSGAGRQTGLSPASVSRQISALEDDLGVRLLNRTSRRLSMTEAGQVYLERAERLLQDMDEMRGAYLRALNLQDPQYELQDRYRAPSSLSRYRSATDRF